MFCHTQNDWEGDMSAQKQSFVSAHLPGRTITLMVQTGKQVTQ